MSSRDHEQRVLDAIENQLRTEEPQLIDYFSAFGNASPLIKPVKGWDRAASSRRLARRGRHRHADRQGYGIVIEVVSAFIAIILIAAVITAFLVNR